MQWPVARTLLQARHLRRYSKLQPFLLGDNGDLPGIPICSLIWSQAAHSTLPLAAYFRNDFPGDHSGIVLQRRGHLGAIRLGFELSSTILESRSSMCGIRSKQSSRISNLKPSGLGMVSIFTTSAVRRRCGASCRIHACRIKPRRRRCERNGTGASLSRRSQRPDRERPKSASVALRKSLPACSAAKRRPWAD